MNQTTLKWTQDFIRIDVDPNHEQPSWLRVGLATVLSIVGSLVADALLVAIGTRLFPSTKGYVHFQFSDYAKLTVIGVVIASIGWPVVTRFSSAPRRVYALLAIVTTLVLFAPDFWLLYKGAPGLAVVVLMVMHVAIALVTYFSMTRIAPIREYASTNSD